MRIAFVCLALVACTRPTTEVKKETKEAVDAAARLVAGTRDDYIKAGEEKLRDVDARLEALKAEVDKTSGDAKAVAAEQLAGLRAKKEALEKDLAELRKDSSDNWKTAQRRLEQTGDAFEQSYADLKKRLETAAK